MGIPTAIFRTNPIEYLGRVGITRNPATVVAPKHAGRDVAMREREGWMKGALAAHLSRVYGLRRGASGDVGLGGK
jgi:hypothetical protein